MALAVNRTGVIFKKCDTSATIGPRLNKQLRGWHLSAYVPTDTVEKCQHAWTLRYWVNGKQLEKSFKDAASDHRARELRQRASKLAQDFQLKLTVDKRSGDITFADHGKSGKQNFGEACRSVHLAPARRRQQQVTTT